MRPAQDLSVCADPPTEIPLLGPLDGCQTMNSPAKSSLPPDPFNRVARPKSPDIVQETIDTMVAVLSRDGLRVNDRHCRLAEAKVRDSWGGTRVYVGKRTPEEDHGRLQRDLAILRAWEGGVSVEELGARHNLTPRRIKQIISESTKWKSDCLTYFHSHS